MKFKTLQRIAIIWFVGIVLVQVIWFGLVAHVFAQVAQNPDGAAQAVGEVVGSFLEGVEGEGEQ